MCSTCWKKLSWDMIHVPKKDVFFQGWGVVFVFDLYAEIKTTTTKTKQKINH